MKRVYIAGSINMDIVASAPRHPQLGETVAGMSLSYFPGGKGANQAVAAAGMGACTHMIGRLGTDFFASKLRAFLERMNVDVEHVSVASGSASGTALVVVADGQNTIVAVDGANATLSIADTERAKVSAGDVLVAQFETPVETTRSFFSRGKATGATTILNPAPATRIDRKLLALSDYIVLNESEFNLLSGESFSSAKDLEAAVTRMRAFDSQTWIVTLGAQGAIGWGPGSSLHRVQGYDVQAVDTTGAGDCFVGSLAACLTEDHDLSRALETANASAAVCVQRRGAGTSMPSLPEVGRLMGRG